MWKIRLKKITDNLLEILFTHVERVVNLLLQINRSPRLSYIYSIIFIVIFGYIIWIGIEIAVKIVVWLL